MAYLDPNRPGLGAKASANPVDGSRAVIGGTDYPQSYTEKLRLGHSSLDRVSVQGKSDTRIVPPYLSHRLRTTRRQRLQIAGLSVAIGAELVLLLISLVPDTIWASHGWPQGPIPVPLYPVVAGCFYLLPAVTGGLSSRWQTAIVLATLPAWFDLGVFAVAAAYRIGPFYLAQPAQAGATAGTLELFAALGILGWFTRGLLQSLVRTFRTSETMSEEERSQVSEKEPSHVAPHRDLVSSLE